MKSKIIITFIGVFLGVTIFTLVGFAGPSTAILIPGTIGDNPLFQEDIKGAKEAAEIAGLKEPKVVEGGDDYASYEKKLISLAATNQYDILVTFTDSMADSIVKVANMFPEQKFILVYGDIHLATEEIPPNLFSSKFRSEDQGYLAGYFAGLVTKSNLPNANEELKIGIMMPDIYPAWNDILIPAYEHGAKAVDPNIEVIQSVLGSWVDVSKGAQAAKMQFAQGVDIILLLTGSACMGAVDEAKVEGKYIIGFNTNIIHLEPDVILGCVLINNREEVKNILLRAYKNTLPFGTEEVVGAKEGVVSFTFDDPNYKQRVPEEIQIAMLECYKRLQNGEINPLGD
ncbi:MAG TPA: BMP family ABC transporter substrate-binding protein [Candidatus Atribacteria bacterium]|uniref:Nucleoside-binding protein n=1 Tax=candidate division TA06 bacterium 34_109 TaxID=1635277 RepID=A0A101I0I6_UNCT6|nr:MAG: Nucleoside-binding protein [candidate division TA06 bacterium 34_109]HBY57212.1 BMP family ABC transporter substrate-binding protein [Candidatus Atribacteria bacterium]